MGCKLSPIFLVFLVVSLIFPIVYADSFGNDNAESTSQYAEDYVNVCRFQMGAVDGTGNNMSVYVDATGSSYLALGICDDSYNLIANTTQTAVSAGTNQWVFCDFSDGDEPSLTANTWYRLAMWFDVGISYHWVAGSADQARRLARDYPSLFPDWPDTITGSLDSARRISIYMNYTTEAGQELTFGLFENFNAWDSSSKNMELSHTFFQNFNLWSSMTHSVETAYLDLTFTLFENFNPWTYLASNKEQSFTFFQPFNLWSSITMASEGVALDLYFTLFEAFNPYASLGTVLEEELTLNDVYGLAALGFIMAIVAICLAVTFKKK